MCRRKDPRKRETYVRQDFHRTSDYSVRKPVECPIISIAGASNKNYLRREGVSGHTEAAKMEQHKALNATMKRRARPLRDLIKYKVKKFTAQNLRAICI